MTDSSVNKPADNEENKPVVPPANKKPDDAAGILVQGHIKIFDPESGETLINKRTS